MLEVFGNRIRAGHDTAEQTIRNVDGCLVFLQPAFSHVRGVSFFLLPAGIHPILVHSALVLQLDIFRQKYSVSRRTQVRTSVHLHTYTYVPTYVYIHCICT